MWLILCEPNDSEAFWAHQHLSTLGLHPIHLVTSDRISAARHWVHRVTNNGASFEIRLQDGLCLDSSRIRGTLNRLVSIGNGIVSRAAVSDRMYAAQETSAFYLSWLNAAPGAVINRPTPLGLCGQWRHASEWGHLAVMAELPPVPQQSNGSDIARAEFVPPALSEAQTPVVVFDGMVYGATLPVEIEQACIRFAKLTRTELIELVLERVDGQYRLVSASPLARLSVGGLPLIHRLASALTSSGYVESPILEVN